MLSPPKKKKLPLTSVLVSIYSRECTQQERNPGHVLDEGVDNITLPKAIFEQSESEVPRAGEDHCASQPNLKTVHVIPIDVELEAEQDVVDDGNRYRGRYSIYKV